MYFWPRPSEPIFHLFWELSSFIWRLEGSGYGWGRMPGLRCGHAPSCTRTWRGWKCESDTKVSQNWLLGPMPKWLKVTHKWLKVDSKMGSWVTLEPILCHFGVSLPIAFESFFRVTVIIASACESNQSWVWVVLWAGLSGQQFPKDEGIKAKGALM